VFLGACLALAIGAPSPSQTAKNSIAKKALQPFRASPEMQRLLDAFIGSWKVSEVFEVSELSQPGKTREGVATFRRGPGASLIEDYTSDGTAGLLNFLAILWWDQSAQLYRFLTCANNNSCAVRGTAKWEANGLVNSWEEEINGRKASIKDSFVDISPTSFRLVSQGLADGQVIWRVVTMYTRNTPGS
jgi:hypothetical protein